MAKKPPKFYKADIGMFSAKEIAYVESLASIGCIVQEIGVVFKLSKATMERRMQVQPEIYDALQRGRVNARIKVRKCAYDLAVSGRHPIMTQFWLRSQDGWKDRHVFEINSSEPSPAAVQSEIINEVLGMTDDELKTEVEALTLELSAAAQGVVYRLPKKKA